MLAQRIRGGCRVELDYPDEGIAKIPGRHVTTLGEYGKQCTDSLTYIATACDPRVVREIAPQKVESLLGPREREATESRAQRRCSDASSPHHQGRPGRTWIHERTVPCERHDARDARGIRKGREPCHFTRNGLRRVSLKRVRPRGKCRPGRHVWSLTRVHDRGLRQASHNGWKDQIERDRKNQYCTDREKSGANLPRPSADEHQSGRCHGADRKREVRRYQPLMVHVRKHSIRPAASNEQFVSVEPVAPGHREQEKTRERCQMTPHTDGDLKRPSMPPEAGCERIKSDHDDGYQ